MCCGGGDALAMSREVERQLVRDRNEDEERVKLLLLGAGESGKSTIFKQFEILYGVGFSDELRREHRNHIWSNIVETVKALHHCAESLQVLDQVENKHVFEEYLHIDLMSSNAELSISPAVTARPAGTMCCGGGDALAMSREVERQLVRDRNEDEERVKLLLLGAGESGKSTIFKQFEILYGVGFSDELRREHRNHIWSNIVETVKALHHCAESLQVLDQVENKHVFEEYLHIDLMSSNAELSISPAQGAAIAALWAEPTVQDIWAQRARFQLIDTAARFLGDMERVASPSYLPTNDDILHSRVRTSGIIEKRYEINDTTFVMLDVGGQRSERRKWMHAFEGVDAVVFVAALSEFNQVLYEDESTNRMIEALRLFDQVCNSRWFTDTSMLLFLNKNDLFEAKIEHVSLGDIHEFRDYEGPAHDYQAGVNYFLGKFLGINRSPKKIYHHVTNATDTSNIAFVFESVKETVLSGNMKQAGF
eukprot:CAMPEP_0198444376 /NCGR_PEP_ID=MMETSP1452-20131203/70575_1 /TAXON_ID=1181717 /ORGANISM="Synchroma pusillum, Strain CCMP3072" /LENGTH=478 /DNA_ID=CAMNT_0044165031 /DNA_START=38 /DNA_END=1475 /DNA_ORIENTATION=-